MLSYLHNSSCNGFELIHFDTEIPSSDTMLKAAAGLQVGTSGSTGSSGCLGHSISAGLSHIRELKIWKILNIYIKKYGCCCFFKKIAIVFVFFIQSKQFNNYKVYKLFVCDGNLYFVWLLKCNTCKIYINLFIVVWHSFQFHRDKNLTAYWFTLKPLSGINFSVLNHEDKVSCSRKELIYSDHLQRDDAFVAALGLLIYIWKKIKQFWIQKG